MLSNSFGKRQGSGELSAPQTKENAVKRSSKIYCDAIIIQTL